VVSEYWCTEDALLNSAESDKGVLRHRTEVNNSEGRPQGCRIPWRQGCVGETQLQTESLRSSVELCQVGMERMRCGAFEGELC
jgi:hypothetical protein